MYSSLFCFVTVTSAPPGLSLILFSFPSSMLHQTQGKPCPQHHHHHSQGVVGDHISYLCPWYLWDPMTHQAKIFGISSNVRNSNNDWRDKYFQKMTQLTIFLFMAKGKCTSSMVGLSYKGPTQEKSLWVHIFWYPRWEENQLISSSAHAVMMRRESNCTIGFVI